MTSSKNRGGARRDPEEICPPQNPCQYQDYDDQVTLDVDGGQLGDGLSGFVILRLSRDVGPGESRDLRELADELKLNQLAELLDGLGRPQTRRLVISLEPDELLRMEEEAARSPWSPLNSLTRYWRVDVRGLTEPVQELAKRFARLVGVETAYAELVVTDPQVNAADDPFSAQQGYLDAAPAGIDARWAWTQTGGEGQGVGIVDLEQGWRLGHEDLAGKAPTLIFNSNRDGVGGYIGNHGTAVMGEIGSDDNTRGVVGIAPSIASLRATSHFDGATALHVADAAVAALPSMSAGDVLLLEVQRGAALLPTESDVADFDAIRLATARGIIVVAAAGNGGNDLDAWTDASGRFRLRRGHPDFRDSGAIMVGAALSPVVGGTAHDRAGFSNFGNRVDCYGWGENVATCGYGDLTPTAGLDASYTGIFGGTSSASPIVVGAAVLTQSLYRTATGTRLSPGQMRAILSNLANGTPQSATVAGNIGSMPNLRQIGDNVLGLVPDVYLRDAVGDSGTIPNAGALSISPDVIVRTSPVANPTASFGEGSGTENDPTLGEQVEAGQDNTIYVRMRNRGASAANGVRATVYWSPVASLVTPNLWTLIGTTPPVNAPTGNTLVVTEGVTWQSVAIPATGHYCFIAVLDHPQDPGPPIPGPMDWDGFLDLIRNHNNVTWRNFNVVNVLPDPSADPVVLPFLLTGAPGEARQFDIEVSAHLPEDARLFLELPPEAAGVLPKHWRELITVGDEGRMAVEIPRLRSSAFCGLQLVASAAHECRFVLNPVKGLALGMHTVGVRQFDGDQQVGGITWALRPERR
jgi:serine protease